MVVIREEIPDFWGEIGQSRVFEFVKFGKLRESILLTEPHTALNETPEGSEKSCVWQLA